MYLYVRSNKLANPLDASHFFRGYFLFSRLFSNDRAAKSCERQSGWSRAEQSSNEIRFIIIVIIISS